MIQSSKAIIIIIIIIIIIAEMLTWLFKNGRSKKIQEKYEIDDTVNHDILNDRLQTTFGIYGNVLSWISWFSKDEHR